MFHRQPQPIYLHRAGPHRPGGHPHAGWKTACCVLLLCALLTALMSALARPEKKPDLPLLQKRFELLMTWTLPEVHWDDMHLSSIHKREDGWLATYRFVIYATEGASPAVRTQLKRRFPECRELLDGIGNACTVEERVRFVPSPPHGLVPESVVRDYPELLSQM